MATPDSLYNQSLAYLEGKGVPKDEHRSFALCAEAAAAGHSDATLAMGWHYLNGAGVPADLNLAEEWYKKSSRKGEAKAMFSLGQMAYTRRDFAEAKIWFERGLEKGHARSGCWLSKVLWRLAETPRDRQDAIRLLQRAAAMKVHDASRLIRTYEKCRRSVA
jgi:TPR repeat protein